MGPAAERLAGPEPRELWLTVGLSILLHGILTLAIVVMPRFHFGHYITVPVTYTVNLVSDPGPAGRAGPAPAPASPARPAVPPASAPAPRVAAPPPARPSDELTLPTRRTRQEAKLREPEPSLRPPAAKPEPARPVPAAPSPAPVAPPVASVPAAPAPAAPSAPANRASGGGGGGQAGGIEVAGTGSGAGGSALGYYLTLVDNKIRSNWVALGGTGADTVVMVRFRVLRSGQVRDIELETGSGNASIDISAVRAIRQSLPLPPFPNLLTDASLDLRYKFVTER